MDNCHQYTVHQYSKNRSRYPIFLYLRHPAIEIPGGDPISRNQEGNGKIYAPGGPKNNMPANPIATLIRKYEIIIIHRSALPY